jgi:hypothetical protein
LKHPLLSRAARRDSFPIPGFVISRKSDRYLRYAIEQVVMRLSIEDDLSTLSWSIAEPARE